MRAESRTGERGSLAGTRRLLLGLVLRHPARIDEASRRPAEQLGRVLLPGRHQAWATNICAGFEKRVADAARPRPTCTRAVATRHGGGSGARAYGIADYATVESVDDSQPLRPPQEDYDANGVDRTLIRACLRETPLECLQLLEEMHRLAESVTPRGKQISSAD